MTPADVHPWNRSAWDSLPSLEAMHSVMLLSGPAGTGKSAFATALAHSLLCGQPASDARACGQCTACRLLLAGHHPDLRVLGGDDDTEVEESGEAPGKARQSRWIRVGSVRLLADFLAFSSHLGGRKVIVVEEADRLHSSAANALLKTLEEPPPRTHFLLVTGKPARLPATVRSRCIKISFQLPGVSVGIDWLRAQGARRPELGLAQAGNAPLTALALDRADYWTMRDQVVQGVLGREELDPVSAVDRLGQDNLALLVHAMQRWTYDLLSLACQGPIRYNPDCAHILHRLAARVPREALLLLTRQLNDVVRSIDHPLNARLVAQRCLFAYRAALRGMEA